MSHASTTGEAAYRLVLAGKMTFEFSAALEDKIIDAMRRYQHLEVDLSGVDEIDLCGIHLLGMLQGFGGKEVEIVATSPIVEQASKRLLSSCRGANLARVARRDSALVSH